MWEGLKIAHSRGVMANGQMVSFEEKPQELLTNNKLERVFMGVISNYATAQSNGDNYIINIGNRFEQIMCINET
ncbi:MAG: hypothetical protein D6732_23430 [Methanobacteriota archaeon]|nr:MAG: hypothetical protein D6732_23430 [Euryarchaeota archaeon]